MFRLLMLALVVLALGGCLAAAAGSGTTGNVSWSFTITNTLPPSAVIPGGGGLVVIITYADGSTATRTVPPGGTLTVPANGTAAVVNGGGQTAQVGPGAQMWWTPAGWSSSPPAPSAAG